MLYRAASGVTTFVSSLYLSFPSFPSTPGWHFCCFYIYPPLSISVFICIVYWQLNMPPSDGARNRPRDNLGWQRGWSFLIGGWGIFLLLSGAIGIIISLMAICTLWWASHECFLWRIVVLNSWMIQTMTIATTSEHGGPCYWFLLSYS